MKNLLRSTLAIAIGLSLAACGSSSDSSTTLSVNGPAPIKGTLLGADVKIYRAAQAGQEGQELDTTQTDLTSGEYSFNLENTTGGAFVIEVTADEDTTMVCDAVQCPVTGDPAFVNKSELVGPTDLAGLTLSTFIYTDGSTTISPKINALTSMATNAILASVDANASLEFSSLTQSSVTELQEDSSGVIASILGVDLNGANIYNMEIVDASNTDDVSTTDSTLATLTLVNAALSGLTPTGTLGETINDYFEAVEAVTTVAFTATKEIPADYSTVTQQIADIAVVQNEVADDVATEAGNISGVTVVEVDDAVDLDKLIATIDEILNTGAINSGGTVED